MKKILLIIVLLFAIPSCSSDENITPQTTSVGITTRNEFTASTTGKEVQRGTLFAWISEMQIKTVNESGYVSTTDFTLVADGTAGAGTQFIIDNVQLGNNTFTASSKTNEVERLETTQFSRTGRKPTNPSDPSILNQFSTLNARNPYAIYTNTNPVTATIVQGVAQEVNIPLKTDNSRIIAVFTTDDIDKTNNKNTVTITCYVDGVVFGPPATCNTSMNATFYWSDQNSTAGKSISFRIVNNDQGILETYDTPPKIIRASNTLKMLYTVTDTGLVITPM